MRMLTKRLGAVALTGVIAAALVPGTVGATVKSAGHWEYVASYPLTSAGSASCRSAGKLWGGTWQCRAINGPHWSHTSSHYHLEIYYAD
ncbi:hypothetical protein [Nonomuraea sp. NPDC049504]